MHKFWFLQVTAEETPVMMQGLIVSWLRHAPWLETESKRWAYVIVSHLAQ